MLYFVVYLSTDDDIPSRRTRSQGTKMRSLDETLRRVYLDASPFPDEEPGYVDAIRAGAQALAAALGAELTPPHNDDSYYRVQVAMTPRVRCSRFALTYGLVRRKREVVYLEILVASIAKAAEASWHVYRADDSFEHESFELLDADFLAAHPALEATAEHVLAVTAEAGIDLLSWDVTRAPADPRLPEEPWMGGTPQLRHFLLPGFWD